MKKIISMLFAILLMATSVNSISEARSINKDDYILKDQQHIITEYVTENISNMLYTHLCSLNENADKHEYTLGYPIKIYDKENSYDIYEFPILSDDKTSYILTVFSEGAEIYAQIEQNNVIAKSEINFNELRNVNDIKSIEIPMERISFDNVKKNRLYANANSKVLPLLPVAQTKDGKFNSTQMNWCAEACCASILNYKKQMSLSAKDVVLKAYGEIVNTGLTNSDLVKVARKYSVNPTTDTPLSYSQVKEKINSYDPVYMRMQRTDSSGNKHYHGVVISGYNDKYYTIINPWNSTPITIDKKNNGKDVKLYTNSRIYSWNSSVIHWS